MTTSIFGTKLFKATKGEMNRVSIWGRRPATCCVPPVADDCCEGTTLRVNTNMNVLTFKGGKAPFIFSKGLNPFGNTSLR